MSYTFESKRDLIYHQNYIALEQAIEQAGGAGEKAIKDLALGLLDTLARNEIELSAKYIGDREET
jgi:hypothetical protein